jgi:hypothetical protein
MPAPTPRVNQKDTQGPTRAEVLFEIPVYIGIEIGPAAAVFTVVNGFTFTSLFPKEPDEDRIASAGSDLADPALKHIAHLRQRFAVRAP